MWGSLSAISEAAQQRLQAELKDFQTEAARAEQWRKECAAKKATEPQIQDADRLIPLPNASAFKTALSSSVSANEAAESFSKVTAPFMSAVVQVPVDCLAAIVKCLYRHAGWALTAWKNVPEETGRKRSHQALCVHALKLAVLMILLSPLLPDL
eukprot:6179440-Pleurochrysis_carterae.AAC.1